MKASTHAWEINDWFPLKYQQPYITHITGKDKLTPFQATCLVRLWAYGHRQQDSTSTPIQRLNYPIPPFRCSQEQAHALFYCDRKEGEKEGCVRSAGQMLQRLVKRNVIKRLIFDGGPACFSLNLSQDFQLPGVNLHDNSEFKPDEFNRYRDETFVANFLAEIYSWVPQGSESQLFNIVKVLRQWAEVYPSGLRVLRKQSNHEPVGFAALFPVNPEFEEKLYQPPTGALHLSTPEGTDPIQVACSGDEKCYAVFVRGWKIKPQYWNYSLACQFFKDSQETLRRMKRVFPNLHNLHSIQINPEAGELAEKIGFTVMESHSSDSLRWLYMSLDQFLELDVEQVFSPTDSQWFSQSFTL